MEKDALRIEGAGAVVKRVPRQAQGIRGRLELTIAAAELRNTRPMSAAGPRFNSRLEAESSRAAHLLDEPTSTHDYKQSLTYQQAHGISTDNHRDASVPMSISCHRQGGKLHWLREAERHSQKD
jgi:hypothetical protein